MCGEVFAIAELELEGSDGSDRPAGFRIDLMDDRRLLLSPSVGLVESVSPNERLRVGDRNDAGDSELCRPDVAAREVMGASLLSSLRDSGISRCCRKWDEYCVRSPGGRGGDGRFWRSTLSGTNCSGCSSCRRRRPRLTEPSGFTDPRSLTSSGDGEFASTDSIGMLLSCAASCEAGMTRFLRLMTDFFIVTGRWTPWSL